MTDRYPIPREKTVIRAVAVRGRWRVVGAGILGGKERTTLRTYRRCRNVVLCSIGAMFRGESEKASPRAPAGQSLPAMPACPAGGGRRFGYLTKLPKVGKMVFP